MERVLGENDKVIVESDVTPYLPLSEVRRNAAPAATAAVPAAQGGQP
jgi:membrane protease subunit HflK